MSLLLDQSESGGHVGFSASSVCEHLLVYVSRVHAVPGFIDWAQHIHFSLLKGWIYNFSHLQLLNFCISQRC